MGYYDNSAETRALYDRGARLLGPVPTSKSPHDPDSGKPHDQVKCSVPGCNFRGTPAEVREHERRP